MENNNKQRFINKILINLIGVFVVIFFVAYFGAYSPAKNIKLLKDKVVEAKIETEKRISREQNMGNLAGKIKKIEKDMQLLEGSFVEEGGELDLITILENIADYNQVKQSINLMPPVQNELLNESIINISARGSFQNIINYLRDLEAVKYYITVTSLNIVKQDENKSETSEQTVNLTVNAKIYWKNYEYKN